MGNFGMPPRNQSLREARAHRETQECSRLAAGVARGAEAPEVALTTGIPYLQNIEETFGERGHKRVQALFELSVQVLELVRHAVLAGVVVIAVVRRILVFRVLCSRQTDVYGGVGSAAWLAMLGWTTFRVWNSKGGSSHAVSWGSLQHPTWTLPTHTMAYVSNRRQTQMD